MSRQMENVFDSLVEQFAALNMIQLAISFLILFFYAWNRFNTWPEVKQKKGSPPQPPNPPNPPRHYTTFLRYSWYAFLYIAAIEMIFLAIVATPGLFDVLAVQAEVFEQVPQENLPLWILIFLTIIMPKTPGLCEMERILLEKLHESALIPSGAQRYINDFNFNPARFKVDEEKLPKELLNEIQKEVLSTDDLLRPDRRLKHRWFKLRYLCHQISLWKAWPQIANYVYRGGAVFNICEQRLNELRREITSYYNRRSHALVEGQIMDAEKNAEKECLDRIRNELENNVDAMLYQAFQFICCGTLATEKTESGRTNTFAFFGLHPNDTNVPPIFVDIIISCVAAVSVITFLATYYYHLAFDAPTPAAVKKVFSWTLVMLLLQGSSITVAILLYRRIAGRSIGSSSENSVFVAGRVTHIFGGIILGYLPGLLIILVYSLLAAEEKTGIMDTALRIWPWPLIPAATSGFIIFHLATLDKKVNRIQETVIQSVTMACVAALAYLLYSSLQGNEIDGRFMLYVTTLYLFAGGTIGAIFPAEYRKRKRSTPPAVDRRMDRRCSLVDQAVVTVTGKEYDCQTLDLSLKGAKIDLTAALEKEKHVTLNIPGLGVILRAAVKNQDQSSTSLTFVSPEERVVQRLRQYLGISPLLQEGI